MHAFGEIDPALRNRYFGRFSTGTASVENSYLFVIAAGVSGSEKW